MSQTYGSKNLKQVGTILQRGILILLLCCFPCWAVFINTEKILLLFRQDPEVSRLTQVYVMIFIPALPAVFMYQLQTRYLQSQAIILPQVVVGVAANILNVGMNALLLYAMKLGVVGSAWANTVSQYTQMILLFLYVRWRKIHTRTWGGWTRECLLEWGFFTRLAVPSMLMMCIEWWTFEIGSFLAGLISVVELGAQSVIYELSSAAYMVPLGFSVAASVRVGNALGSGDAEQARTSCISALLCTGVLGVVVAALLGTLKDVVGYIFTNDKEIVTLVSTVMLLFAPFHLFDAMAATCGGVLRGTGKQKFGAIANAIGYYAIGFPLGISLMFAAKLGVLGSNPGRPQSAIGDPGHQQQCGSFVWFWYVAGGRSPTRGAPCSGNAPGQGVGRGGVLRGSCSGWPVAFSGCGAPGGPQVALSALSWPAELTWDRYPSPLQLAAQLGLQGLAPRVTLTHLLRRLFHSRDRSARHRSSACCYVQQREPARAPARPWRGSGCAARPARRQRLAGEGLARPARAGTSCCHHGPAGGGPRAAPDGQRLSIATVARDVTAGAVECRRKEWLRCSPILAHLLGLWSGHAVHANGLGLCRH
uniref:Multidrug and toxin extrusion protein n=1 Tax=Crocodylus porosus TaxID=8502 RepID=A0A7M4F1N6_CROPO